VETARTDPPKAPPPPPDGELREARGLFAADGKEAVASFLAARAWVLKDVWPVQASYTPERSCIVRYQVRALNSNGDPSRVSICVEARTRKRETVDPPPDFERRFGLAAPVERTGPYLVWAFPYDPSLLLLPEAASDESMRDVLTRRGERPSAVSIAPCAYRPTRRAVFKYVSFYPRGMRDRSVTFGKVLPAKKARRVLAASANLARGRGLSALWPRRKGEVQLSLPFIHVGERALFFEGVRGRQLQDLLVVDGPLPEPARVARVPLEVANLERRGVPGSLPARADPLRAARESARLVTHLVPETERAAHLILDAVHREHLVERSRRCLVHGDLYEAQLFVHTDYTLGLIDLDDLGLGDPGLDAANFSAHLVALALCVPTARSRILAYRSLVRAAFLAQLDMSDRAFAWREALCMLLLASGPFRVLDPGWPYELKLRVDLAVRLLQSRAGA
jgi:streptomycin 6-kinase